MKAVFHVQVVHRSPVVLASFLIGFGLLALITPVFAANNVVVLVACLLMFSAVTQLVYACAVEAYRSNLRQAIWCSGLYLGAGLWLQTSADLSITELVVVLVLFFLVQGLIDAIILFSCPKGAESFWLFFSGLITIALPITLWIEWPTNPTWALAVLTGVSMAMSGGIRLLLALSIERRPQSVSVGGNPECGGKRLLSRA